MRSKLSYSIGLVEHTMNNIRKELELIHIFKKHGEEYNMKRQVEITVPKDWSAVTLKQYLELKKDMDAYAGEPEAILACMFHHLAKFPVEYIQSLDMNTYTNIVRDMTSFLANVELPLKKFIHIDGVEYGFEPNLSQMSYGAYVDISKYEEMQINEKWAEIMSILYRPVVKKVGKLYDIEPYSAKIDGNPFMDITMDVHFGAIFFFKTLLKDLLSSIQKSLMQETEMLPSMREILEKNGKAIQAWSNLQTEISSNLKK